MPTKTAPKKPASSGIPNQNPSQDYIDKGIRDAQNFAKKGIKNVAKKGVASAKKTAGRASGIGDVAEQAQDARAMVRGSMKERLAAGKRTAIRAGANAAAIATLGNKELSPVYQKALEVVTSKKFWRNVIILIIALFLLFFTLFDLIFDPPPNPNADPLQVTKSAPSQVANGSTIDYSIVVNYAGSADDITITDPLPDGTTYVSSTPQGKYDKATNTITWDAKSLNLPLTNPISIPLAFTVKTTKKDFYAINQASAVVTGGTAGGATGGGTGGNVPPNNDPCGGKYTLNNPFNNFGDPQCNFSVQKFGQTINQLDAANAFKWKKLVECESSNNPNAYLAASASTHGAFGLFQMNQKGYSVDKTGYDVGNVNWSQQIPNAVNLLHKHYNGDWQQYWQCARNLGL